MTGLLRDCVAVVTGAGRGIGLAVSQVFARESATIVLVDRGSGQAAAAAERLLRTGVRAEAFPCDVADPDAVDALMAFTSRKLGGLDILVNNAAIRTYHTFEQLTIDAWRETIAVNLSGVFFCTRSAVPLMQGKGGGRIVNIGSMGTRYGSNVGAHYAASKGGIVAFTRTVAKELAKYRILVNCVAAPVTSVGEDHNLFAVKSRTEVLKDIPLQRLAKPEEVAELVLWVASPRNTYLTGETIWLSGGR